MKFILGKKIGMSRRFLEDGTVVPVTLVQAGPCTIIQIKDKAKEGYEAVQVGFEKKRKISKPLKGHLKNLGNFRYLREFRIKQPEQLKPGDTIDVSIFKEGDLVQIAGVSKGKGFQGVVKRHGFHGSPASHGHKDQLRMPGSIGSAFPEHVLKGKKMAGRMGAKKTSVRNLKIVNVDLKNNQLAIKGAVPGARNNLVLVLSEGEVGSEQKRPAEEKLSPRSAKEKK